jgi:hypothetical protein
VSKASDVIHNWSIRKDDDSLNLHSTGGCLYSYNHLIGSNFGDEVVVIDCHFTKTTAKHCNMAKQYATRIATCEVH